MDPLGLLLEVVAVAVYPGGLFLALLACLTHRTAGVPAGSGLDVRGLAAITAAALAASMASLPGSPAASLPPPGGAAPNLLAAALLLFAAGSLLAQPQWAARRAVALCLGGVSLLVLGLVAASFSIPSVSAAGGAGAETARILAAITALLAVPMVVQPFAGAPDSAARVTVVAASVEVVLGIVIPPSLQWPAGPLAVAGLVAATVLYALLLRLGRGAATRVHPSLVAVVAAGCAAASVAAVIAARP